MESQECFKSALEFGLERKDLGALMGTLYREGHVRCLTWAKVMKQDLVSIHPCEARTQGLFEVHHLKHICEL